PLPISTLFPYTTLFRSYGVLFGAGGGAGYILMQQAVNLAVTRHRGLMNGYLVALYPAGAMIAAPLFGWSVRDLGVRATLGGLAADRKSTRLNSSHDQIS